MKRRFNYTGRKKIPREKISISLNRDNNRRPQSFRADMRLNDLHLPPESKVYIEAYHRTEVRRYVFGTVRNLIAPEDTGLADIGYSDNLKFRVLLVDESGTHGLILAHADRIKPEASLERRAILPVAFDDLGRQIWRIEFAGDDNAPLLVLNRNIPNIENIARSDPQFILYVYPQVIREVLSHTVFVDGVDSQAEPDIDWHKDWLDFTKTILPGVTIPEILDPHQDGFDKEEVQEWINKVVEEFCASRPEWNAFILFFIRGGGT